MERMENQDEKNNQEVELVAFVHGIVRNHVRAEIWVDYPAFLASHWLFVIHVAYVQPKGDDAKASLLEDIIYVLTAAESWMHKRMGDSQPLVTGIHLTAEDA